MRAEEPRRERNANQIREVYFVRAATMGLIKVGVANFSIMRLPSLQTGSPDKLELIGVMVCPRHGALEWEIHQRFAHLRSHGEWFRPEPELLTYIAENALDSAAAGLLRLRYERGEPAIHENPILPPDEPQKFLPPSTALARALALCDEEKTKKAAKRAKGRPRRVPVAVGRLGPGRTMKARLRAYKEARGLV